MLPENQTPSSFPQQLFFCYNTRQKDILYATAPIALFLSSTADPAAETDFFSSTEWNSLQTLATGEEASFIYKNTYGNFSCKVKVAFLPNDGSLLMCTLTRESSVAGIRDADHYEEFIHLAAHDLDAPLRKLSVLIERMTAKLTPGTEGTEFIPRIEANIKDLRAMIDGLTLLAKASLKANDDVVDTGKLIADIVAESRRKNSEKHIQLEIAQMPLLQGDEDAYRQLFRELIQNAVLFSESDKVFIEISAADPTKEEKNNLRLQTGTKFCKITVRDNGIGFSEEDAERIFQPFVRLHGKSAYPGSGLGLAICKKIVESHHGRIYGRGTENEGTRFVLFLPQSLN